MSLYGPQQGTVPQGMWETSEGAASRGQWERWQIMCMMAHKMHFPATLSSMHRCHPLRGKFAGVDSKGKVQGLALLSRKPSSLSSGSWPPLVAHAEGESQPTHRRTTRRHPYGKKAEIWPAGLWWGMVTSSPALEPLKWSGNLSC